MTNHNTKNGDKKLAQSLEAACREDAWFDQAYDKLGNHSVGGDWHTRYRAAQDELEKLLTHIGFACSSRFDGYKVRMAGFGASSTSSLSGALGNWISGAKRRLEAGK